MVGFLAGVAATVALLAVLALLFVAFGRRSPKGSRAPGTFSRSRSMFADELPPDPGMIPNGNPQASGDYKPGRVPPRTGMRWDPFDPANSRTERVRAARHRPRVAERSRGRDLYTLLGVEPQATDTQIERAYRARASGDHPDRHFGDPARRREAELKLKELNAAMQVLRDPIQRAKYDASR